MPRTTKMKLIMYENPLSPIAEVYRSLRFNLECAEEGREVRIVTITSIQPGEGKTTTAVNLAAAAAKSGKRVVLIDADMRKPSVHRFFNVDNKQGLSNFLAGQLPFQELMKESIAENIAVISSGPVPINPSELLSSKRLIPLLDALRKNYDLVLIDTPPALGLVDAKITASCSDGVLLVVQHGKVKTAAAKKVKEEFAHVNARLLGVVMNKTNRRDARLYLYNEA